MNLIPLKPGPKVFDNPRDCQALALHSVVAAFHIYKDAVGIANGLVVPICVLSGQDCPRDAPLAYVWRKNSLPKSGWTRQGKDVRDFFNSKKLLRA